MVVVHAIATAKGTLARLAKYFSQPCLAGEIRGPGEGKAGRNVFVIPIPNRRLPIGLTRQDIVEYGLDALALGHAHVAVAKPLVDAGGGRHLRAGGFIGWLQKAVTGSKRNCEIWFYPPRILRVPLGFMRAEVASHHGTFRQQVKIFRLLVGGGNLGHHAGQGSGCEVVRCGKRSGNFGITVGGKLRSAGIEASARPGNSAGSKPCGIRGTVDEGLRVRLPKVVDDPHVGAELERMLAFRPSYVIHKIVQWHLNIGGRSLSDGIGKAPSVKADVTLRLQTSLA